MESKKILMVMALIDVLLPSALARRAVVDFETDDSAIANVFSEPDTENLLSDIILKGLENKITCGRCVRLNVPCTNIRCVCVQDGRSRQCVPRK